jgi:hypothetical protein
MLPEPVCRFCGAPAESRDDWRLAVLWTTWPPESRGVHVPRCARCRRRQRWAVWWWFLGFEAVVLAGVAWPNYRLLVAYYALPERPTFNLVTYAVCTNLCFLVIAVVAIPVARGVWRWNYLARRSEQVKALRGFGWSWREPPKGE